ncbi:MAG: hypothetical protein ACREPM_07980 [Gemmatimonadaceae bacterium]
MPLLKLLRGLAAVQLIVGIGFWTGHWFGLRMFHMTVGVLFVLVLWSIAVIALRAKRATSLAVGTIAWGLLVAALGAMQQQLLIGDWHWTIRVLHLGTAVAALPMAERLGRSAT